MNQNLNLYINHNNFQVLDPSGRFLRAFGSQGTADGRFNYPWGITTDALGFIYVCDKENHRVQVHKKDERIKNKTILHTMRDNKVRKLFSLRRFSNRTEPSSVNSDRSATRLASWSIRITLPSAARTELLSPTAITIVCKYSMSTEGCCRRSAPKDLRKDNSNFPGDT